MFPDKPEGRMAPKNMVQRWVEGSLKAFANRLNPCVTGCRRKKKITLSVA